MNTTDKDREEAREFIRQLEDESNVFAREIFVTDAFARIRSESDARWKAAVQHLTATDAESFTQELIRARSEAAAEKEREMMHQINAATQKVIRLSSGEYVNAVAWVDAMEKEAKAETLREAVNRVHGIKLKWRKNDTARIKDYKQAANESLDHAIVAILGKEFRPECTWTFNGYTAWESACGRSWGFEDGGPEDNGVRYCHGCGKPVRIADEPNKEE